MIRLALFDIDGTLIQTGGAGIKAFAKAFAGEFQIMDATRGMSFAGRTDTGLVRLVFVRNGIEPSPANFRRFFDSYVFWLEQMLHECEGQVCPGARDFIAEMEALPQPPVVGLLTGNIRLGAEIKLRHFNLWELFKMGAFADDHEDRNQISAIAHRRSGEVLKGEVRGDEILVIGDTPLDVECGRAIGAKVLAVATGSSSVAELREHHPDWVVENLTQISAREVCGGTH